MTPSCTSFLEKIYIFIASFLSISNSRVVNLTNAEVRDPLRLESIQNIPKSDFIIYSASNPSPSKTLRVFTDVDCGYCRKFHQAIPDLNEAGISVHYMAFPRTGIPSESFDKMVSAWCSSDKNGAMDELKKGNNIPSVTCSNAVKEQYELGQKLGVNGTPTLVHPNGSMLPGLLPTEQIIQWMKG